jgi:anti-anti-sigma factor
LESLAQDGNIAVYSDRQLIVTRTREPVGLMFTGEIDLTNSAAVAETLAGEFPPLGDAHLDLRRLQFCDVSGIRVLVDAALTVGSGRRLLLHGLPGPLQNVIRVTGWSDAPSLVLCDCRVEQP